MSKAAHNSCQAGADIPTGLGMRQKSTFAMSRLRHKRAVGRILPQNWHLCDGEDFLTDGRLDDLLQTVQLHLQPCGLLATGRFMD